MFKKQIKACYDINSDVPEYSRYQDLIEGHTLNKDIKGLPHFVNDHVLKVLDKKEEQTVVKIMECLTKKFGCSQLEKMKEWLDNWMEFKEGVRKKKLKVTDQELMTLWMLKTVKKGKRVVI